MSGTEFKTIFYWDACTYLVWLVPQQQQLYGKQATDAISHVAKLNAEKKAIIATSTVIFIEVLSASLTEEQERQFRKSFRGLDHTAYDLTPPIAMKARDFRQRLNADGLKLKTPDAIHLATAAILKAAELWTFDNDLLRLNGDERVDRLKICNPSVNEPNLF